jgi:mannitol/fructose-specific phosphotransferase system IIA component (Ntr-type)
MTWWKQFKPSACVVKLKSTSKEDVFDELVGTLVKAKVLDAALSAAASKALAEREALASTGVGMGVAIPHVKLSGLERVACSLAVQQDGLEWAAVDGEPVRILFLVLRPDGATSEYDPEEHLEMMRWVAGLGREPDFRAFALQAKTKSELVGLLKEMSPV